MYISTVLKTITNIQYMHDLVEQTMIYLTYPFALTGA